MVDEVLTIKGADHGGLFGKGVDPIAQRSCGSDTRVEIQRRGSGSLFLPRGKPRISWFCLPPMAGFIHLDADKLPGGRGHGEPVRLMVDMGNDHDIVSLHKYMPGRTLIVASSKGHGFLVDEDDVIASTRNGKKILNVSGDVEAQACAEADGDTVAVIGENRKLLLFDIEEVPKMAKGRGVVSAALQRWWSERCHGLYLQ